MDYYLTRHASDRLKQMRDVTCAELDTAFRRPTRTWGDERDAETRVAGRIALIVVRDRDGSRRIATVVWADDDLWRRAPAAPGRAARA